MTPNQQQSQFVETVWDYYHTHARHDLPWRQSDNDGTFDPYKIWISEIMLQQTQVNRVIPKFNEFIERFPTVEALRSATLSEVFAVWNGLGYNRRAKFLHEAAKMIDGNQLPRTTEELIKLPGIGANTAVAIATYSHNEVHPFIETNIRTVFIHHFFPDKDKIDDKELLPIIIKTIDVEQPREWFWALMDYGTHLKATIGNASRASKQYARQSKFHGSRRQLRANVLKALLEKSHTKGELQRHMKDERLESVLADLKHERFITLSANRYQIT